MKEINYKSLFKDIVSSNRITISDELKNDIISYHNKKDLNFISFKKYILSYSREGKLLSYITRDGNFHDINFNYKKYKFIRVLQNNFVFYTKKYFMFIINPKLKNIKEFNNNKRKNIIKKKLRYSDDKKINIYNILFLNDKIYHAIDNIIYKNDQKYIELEDNIERLDINNNFLLITTDQNQIIIHNLNNLSVHKIYDGVLMCYNDDYFVIYSSGKSNVYNFYDNDIILIDGIITSLSDNYLFAGFNNDFKIILVDLLFNKTRTFNIKNTEPFLYYEGSFLIYNDNNIYAIKIKK